MTPMKWHYFTFEAPPDDQMQFAAVEATTPLIAQRRLAAAVPWAANVLYTTATDGRFGPAVVSIASGFRIPTLHARGSE